MFCWQETFAQQTLEHGFDAWSMHQLQNKQVRLQRTERTAMSDVTNTQSNNAIRSYTVNKHLCCTLDFKYTQYE